VPDGLSWSNSSVAASDGSLFSLSTAPGPAPTDTGKVEGQPPTLYRSTDGRAWNAAGLPADLSASSLATSDGRLYAVGTAPGGGGIDIVVASSSDGAQTWSETRIPQPAAALKAQFPDEVHVSSPVITTGVHGLVAAVTVTAYPDLNRLLPNDGPFTNWHYTDAGVDIYGDPNAGGRDCLSVTPSDSSGSSANSSDPSASPSTLAASGVCDKKSLQVTKSYTWDQLHLDPALRAMLNGEVHTYASTDGSSFAETVSPGLPAGFVAARGGSDDGYRMLVSDGSSSVLHPLFSADGQTWVASGSDLSGWVRTAGLLGSTPAAVLELTKEGTPTLLLGGAGGGWSAHDMGLPVTSAPNSADQMFLQDVAIGPLGVVALASNGNGSSAAVYESVDGVHFITHPLLDLAGPGNWSPAGITMNADAVTIRMMPTSDANQPSTNSTPGPQRLLVGVPS